jgi:hypothetical protein
LYENFAEATVGKVNDMDNVLPPAAEDLREKAEAEEEEERAAAAKEAGAGGEAVPEGGAKLGRSSKCFWLAQMSSIVNGTLSSSEFLENLGSHGETLADLYSSFICRGRVA